MPTEPSHVTAAAARLWQAITTLAVTVTATRTAAALSSHLDAANGAPDPETVGRRLIVVETEAAYFAFATSAPLVRQATALTRDTVRLLDGGGTPPRGRQILINHLENLGVRIRATAASIDRDANTGSAKPASDCI